MIKLQNHLSLEGNKQDIGKVFEVLAEGTSKKSEEELVGRTPQNKVVVFPAKGYQKGDFVQVKINRCTQTTLIGESI